METENPPKLSIHDRDFNALITWLKTKVDVIQINLDTFSTTFIKHLELNAYNAITNKRSSLSTKEFSFIAYKILNTSKSNTYIQKASVCGEPFYYVIFERETGYILSNVSKLYLELVIEQGIDEQYYNEKAEYFAFYTNCIRAYNAQEY